MGNKRYCSLACRQRLRLQLNMRTGLLKALNTRYATFCFSESEIFLDILTLGSRDLFHFAFPRILGGKPADDFIRMTNCLSKAWWEEKRRTDRHYLANRHVLACAQKNNSGPSSGIAPQRLSMPVVPLKILKCLQMSRADLNSPEPASAIKSAYRRMAKISHPDQGGEAAQFRKIHDAYRELIQWSENPRFTRRVGFVDKWFYTSAVNRWVQPRPLS